jgi:hypothetical protein
MPGAGSPKIRWVIPTEPPGMNRIRRLLLPLSLLLLIPLGLVLLRGGNGFAYSSPDAKYSDLTLSHYTNTLFVREQLVHTGDIPLWSPVIFSGYPFIANPLNGLWYPFGWPALILPLPFGFNVLVGLHLVWGGAGLAALLRRRGLSIPAALTGGLMFALLPKLFAHYGAGHLTLLYAVPWTPWLLLAAVTAHKKYNLLWKLLPGVILAFIFLADVRWAAYAGALWVGWEIYLYFRSPQEKSLSSLGRGLGWIFLQAALAAALVLVLALPMREYTQLSTRAALSAQDVFFNSLPLAGVLGLIYPPTPGGTHETTFYPGAVVLGLVLLTLTHLRRDDRLFWAAAAILSLLWAFGSALPFSDMLARLPLVSLLRVPPRGLFIFGIALAALAASALDGWLELAAAHTARRARLILVGWMMFTTALAGMILVIVQPPVILPFASGAGFSLVAGGFLIYALGKQLSKQFFVGGILLLFLADAGINGQLLVSYRSWEQVTAVETPAARYLASQPGDFRVYSPTFSILQHTAYAHGLSLAEGVDPLQLENYAGYMRLASGILDDAYTVTLPAVSTFPEENAVYVPDAARLGKLSVYYVLAAANLPQVDDLEYLTTLGGIRIYANRSALPRARVVPAGINADGVYLPAIITQDTPNRLEVQAQGPGTLILAEVAYPGWQVHLDGQPAQLNTCEKIFRCVELPPGTHTVDFIFRPRSFELGVWISAAAWLGVLLLVVVNHFRRGKNETFSPTKHL